MKRKMIETFRELIKLLCYYQLFQDKLEYVHRMNDLHEEFVFKRREHLESSSKTFCRSSDINSILSFSAGLPDCDDRGLPSWD
jgi:hypothetical protein